MLQFTVLFVGTLVSDYPRVSQCIDGEEEQSIHNYTRGFRVTEITIFRSAGTEVMDADWRI